MIVLSGIVAGGTGSFLPTLTLSTPAPFTTTTAAGTLVATVSGLASGETVASVNVPQLAVSGANIIVGLTAATAGTLAFIVTTSLGRTVSGSVAVTSGAAYITIPNYSSILVMGDSYTDPGALATPTGSTGSPSANSFAPMLATSLGATLVDRGVAGSVLQNSNDSTGSPRVDNGRGRFMLASTANNGGVVGANAAPAIFMAMGYNDGRYVGAPSTFNVTQYQSKYREVINGLLLGGYTRSNIYIISPWYPTDTGLNTGSTGFAGQTRSGFAAFVTAAAAVAAEFGLQFVDAYTPAGANSTYTADIDAQDHVHPGNTGHAILKGIILNQMTRPNTLAAPASVTISVSGATVTAVASAVAGAASYEYALVANPVDYASNTSGTFASAAAGTYYARARAVFSDGTKSPWAYSASAATVAATPGIFAQDNFTDTSGTLITAHAPQVGGSWVAHTNSSGTNGGTIDANGRLYASAINAVYQTGAPSSADYYVEADIVRLSTITGDTAGVGGRMDPAADTYYWARYSNAAGGWQLFKTVAGTSTQLGSTSAGTFADSTTKRIRLTMTGTAISASVDGTVVIGPITDTAITAAGQAGTRISSATTQQTATVGMHLDNFVAST